MEYVKSLFTSTNKANNSSQPPAVAPSNVRYVQPSRGQNVPYLTQPPPAPNVRRLPISRSRYDPLPQGQGGARRHIKKRKTMRKSRRRSLRK